MGRNIFRARCAQFDPLAFRACHMKAHTILNQAGQVESLVIDDKLAGFDLRDIEDVVEQHHHGSSRPRDEVGIARRFRIQLHARKQVGKTEHPVHRCADFVAHIGEELGLGAGGVFRMPGGAFKLSLEFDPFGDVTGRYDDAFPLSRGVIECECAVGFDIDR